MLGPQSTMSQETPTWTEDNIRRNKITFKFRTRDEFFGKNNNPRAHYDKNILKRSIIDIARQCQVETINLHTHLYNRDEDPECLTDYAFALLWFAGYIISPRHTARRKLDYTMFGKRNQVKPLLTLYSEGRLILFVAHARSINEGLPIIMAGIMRMNVSEFPKPDPRTVRTNMLIEMMPLMRPNRRCSPLFSSSIVMSCSSKSKSIRRLRWRLV